MESNSNKCERGINVICEKCGQEMEHIEIIDQVGEEPVTYSYLDTCEKCGIILQEEVG